MPTSQRPRRKKKQLGSKKHETYVQWEDVGTGRPIEVHWDSMGKFFSPDAVDGTYRVTTGYERDSGKRKVLFEQSALSGGAHWLPDRQLLAAFRRMACVDTNTTIIEGTRVSVACLGIVDGELEESKPEMKMKLHPFVIFDVPNEINPELVGLDIALNYYIRPVMQMGETWGVVTDSDLGKHEKINSNEAPYLGKSYLPSGFKLVYASADSGQGASNTMIRACDSKAKEILEMFKEQPEATKVEAISHPYCRGFLLIEQQD